MREIFLIIQIQKFSQNKMARSFYYLLECVACVIPANNWSLEMDGEQDWCNIYIKTSRPEPSWRSVYNLIALEPKELRLLSGCWIVLHEGSKSWWNYKIISHFNKKQRI
jgi:hypothetical protein